MSDGTIQERLSFLTDIITSYDGHEQRIKLRSVPRRQYIYSYDAMNKYDANWMRNILRIPRTEVYYVPLWHRHIKLSEKFFSGSSALYIEADYTYSFFNCDMLEIFYTDEPVSMTSNKNLYRRIKRISEGIVALTTRISRDMSPLNTNIFPIRPCYITTEDAIDCVYSNGASGTLTFTDALTDSIVSFPSSLSNTYQQFNGFNRFNFPLTYNNHPVCFFTPQWLDNDWQLSVGKLYNNLDNSTGYIYYDLRNAKSYDSFTVTLYFMNIFEINNFYKFMLQLAGRYTSFYCPTWVNDIEVSFDINISEQCIYTKYQLNTYFELNTRHKYLIIFTKSFSSNICKIVGFDTVTIDDVTYCKILLEGLTRTYYLSDILMVSFFNLVRLASDDVLIDYETVNVAKSSIVMQEVDDDE